MFVKQSKLSISEIVVYDLRVMQTCFNIVETVVSYWTDTRTYVYLFF